MRILIVGGTGTIGSKLHDYFKKEHEVIVAASKSGDVRVDIEDSSSIKQMFERVGKVNGIIVASGKSKWAAFEDISEEDYYIGFRSKLMGQVNLVRIGKDYIIPGGSITLTSGILGDDPVRNTASAAMVNGALHSFVKAVVLEIDPAIRVNVVAPGLVEDSAESLGHYFPGHNPVSMQKVTNAYIRSLEGSRSGEIIRIYE